MNWFQLVAALYVLGLAVFLYLCDTAPVTDWTDL